MSHLQLWQRKQKIANAQTVPNAHDAGRWLKSCTSWYLVDPIISWLEVFYLHVLSHIFPKPCLPMSSVWHCIPTFYQPGSFSRFSYVIVGDFRVLVTSWWNSPGRNTPSCQFRATLAPLIRELLAKPSTCGKSHGAELFWSGFLLIGSNETRKGFIIFMYVAVEMSKTCGPHTVEKASCV